MQKILKRIPAAILSGALCLTVLGGCSSTDTPSNGQNSENPSEPAQQDVASTYKPSELAIQSQDKYEYPFMGLSFTLPKSLLEQMDQQTVAMLHDTSAEDASSIHYSIITWNQMTPKQRDEEVASKGNGYYEWADKLERIGTLGVYHADQVKNLDNLTKCTEHKDLGKSTDGTYSYYLSINPQADKTLTEAVSQIAVQITEMVLEDEEDGSPAAAESSLGEFSLKDIKDETYTQEMFQDYDLTMVNVFTTWCTPCINEIPDLEKLHTEMADKRVNVIGIILDAVNESGNTDPEAVEKAKLIAERTGATYPFLIPDAGYLNGRLIGIDAVPETFFVDQNGSITGDTYSGSHDLESWKAIVETELGRLQGDAS